LIFEGRGGLNAFVTMLADGGRSVAFAYFTWWDVLHVVNIMDGGIVHIWDFKGQERVARSARDQLWLVPSGA